MNKLWFIVMQTHGDGRLKNGDGHERGSIKEELECCRERNSVISPSLSMHSLILSFFCSYIHASYFNKGLLCSRYCDRHFGQNN